MKTLLTRFGVFGVILILWAAVAYNDEVSPIILSQPHLVAIKFFSMFVSDSLWSSGHGTGGTIWPHLGMTLLRVFIGLLYGTVIGVPIGILMGSFKSFSKTLEAPMGMARAIPVTALGGVFMWLFGLGDVAKFAMVTWVAANLMAVGAIEGIRASENSEVVEAAKLDGASNWQLIRYITTDLALPQIYANIRVCYQIGIVVIIVLEQNGAISRQGLGALLFNSQMGYRVDETWAIIILLGMLGLAVDYGLKRLRPWLIPW
jgi:NitT/TauT family transport system permease protein